AAAAIQFEMGSPSCCWKRRSRANRAPPRSPIPPDRRRAASLDRRVGRLSSLSKALLTRALLQRPRRRLRSAGWSRQMALTVAIALMLAGVPGSRPESTPAYAAGLTPNDELFDVYQWNLRQIHAPEAWSLSIGATSVIVA